MPTKIRPSLLFSVVLGAALALNAPAQEAKPAAPNPLSAERWVLATVFGDLLDHLDVGAAGRVLTCKAVPDLN